LSNLAKCTTTTTTTTTITTITTITTTTTKRPTQGLHWATDKNATPGIIIYQVSFYQTILRETISQGVQNLTGENQEVVWAEFST
jgi:hypothetical protein